MQTEPLDRELATTVAQAQHRYRAVGEVLDTLGIAICIFDHNDRTILWNNTFLRFFPEHAPHVYAGEHYRENLRRFYNVRLAEGDRQYIDEYIERGISRHRSQQRPFTYEHRGRWIRVAVQTLSEIGRMRVWTEVPAPTPNPHPAGAPQAPHSEPAQVTRVENVPDAILVLDRNNCIVSLNDRFRELYEVAASERVVGSTFEQVLRSAWKRDSAGGERHFEEKVLPMLRDEQRFAGVAFEVPLPFDRWVRVIEQRSIDGYRTCVHFDITQFKRKQRELQLAEIQAREQEARFRAVIERSPVGMSIASADGTFAEVNEAYGRVFGYSPAELLGRALWDMIDPVDIARSQESIGDLVAGRISSMEMQTQFIHRDGSRRWAIHSAVYLRNGAVGGEIISQVQDVTARLQAEMERDVLLTQLAHRAAHDPLTGLPNRAAFEQALGSAVEMAQASGNVHTLCFIDLDGFKAVNDTAGHATGDLVLSSIGRMFRERVRSSDFVARLGGDEFGLILYDCAPESACELAKGLIKGISSMPVSSEGRDFHVGLSIGIAAINGRNASIQELLSQADQACYRAKHGGRNRAEIYR